MFDDWQRMDGYAKQHLIEKIMCFRRWLPKRLRQYRDELEAMTLAEVRRERELIANEMKGEQ